MITPEMATPVAARLDCEVASVLAVADVESNGSGYLPDGRPAILFEAHLFSSFTAHRYDATHPMISSPSWNRALYRGGAGEYTRLEEAYALDATAALKSASWGAFQILGMNATACGFANVQDFVSAMKGPLDNHLNAFCAFIEHDMRLLNALRSKDWRAFAQVYNGPGAVASYSAKMADAYARHAGENVVDIGPPIPVGEPSMQPANPGNSKTLWTYGLAGAGTAGGVADQLANASSALSTATSAGYSIQSLMRLAPIVLGVLVLAAIAYGAYRYWQKMKAGDVVSR